MALYLLFIANSCSEKDKTPEKIDIAVFYATADTASLLAYIEGSQTDVRQQIGHKLEEYLRRKSQSDSDSFQELSSEIEWYLSLYTQKKNNRDLGIKWEIYKNWENSQIDRKLYLDSLMINIAEAENISTESYPDLLRKLLPEYSGLSDSFKLASIKFSLAEYYYEEEKIDSSLVALSQCQEISESLGIYDQLGHCELLKAKILNLYKADYTHAEKAYIAATRAYAKTNNSYYNLFAIIGRGSLLVQLNQSDLAIKLLRIALNGFEQRKRLPLVALCHYYLAEAFYNKGEFDSALSCVGMSLNYYNKNAHSGSYGVIQLGYSLSCRGLIYHAQGKYHNSLRDFETAEGLFVEADENAGFCLNTFRMASLVLDYGDYEKADSLYRRVLVRSDRFEETLFSIFGLGICDYFRNYLSAAINKLHTCIDMVETAKRAIPVSEIKSGLMSDKVGFYHLLSVIFIEQYKSSNNRIFLDSAFTYLERSKASAMVDELSPTLGQKSTLRDQEILNRLSHLQKNLILKSGDPEQLEKEIDKFEDSLRVCRLENDLLPEDLPDKTVSIDIIQNDLLNQGDILLEYLMSEFGTYVFIINKYGIDVVSIGQTAAEIHNDIQSYLNIITKYPDKKELLKWSNGKAESLHSILIPQSINTLHSFSRLVIIPSGILHNLPFESLLDNNNKFLIDKCPVVYAPSSTILYMLHARNNIYGGHERMVAFGSPTLPRIPEIDKPETAEYYNYYLYDISSLPDLPHAQEEVNTIMKIFGEEMTDIHMRDQARESSFKVIDYTNVRYVHLATHGIINDLNPSRSAIILSIENDSLNDGLLQPAEIMDIEFETELVFLSACRSGAGKYYPGEGIMSLARPFLIAGCDAAIASLWNVNDRSATKLVSTFYRYLKQGKSKSQALQLAKRELITSERELYRHPYFWASFVLAGSDH